MVRRAEEQRVPARVVDPGCGSGRFLVAAGRRFPEATLLGVEIDPVAALLARGHLAAAGLASRARICLGDYRDPGVVPAAAGPTLFIGNPPYVRHHGIASSWKRWLASEARSLGLAASGLSGLHVHFFLATVKKARPGDFGVFVTAAEWLDVNYGELIRKLFLGGLGGQSIVLIEPTALPFQDAATTAVITAFEAGSRPRSIEVRRVRSATDLNRLHGGRQVSRERLAAEPRWTRLTLRTRPRREGFVELGSLCRVHRGQVTGANEVWIAGAEGADLPPSVLFPAVTHAREIIRSAPLLATAQGLRCVIDLPLDLDVLDGEDGRAVAAFLREARARGAHLGYVAKHRKAWWSVGLRAPAPILATYMARRPPAFVRNLAGVRHINIAHGIYPREPLAEGVLQALTSYLAKSTHVSEGRTYAGGLTKFEPREMERLLVPEPAALATS
jgi:hypothetical protein